MGTKTLRSECIWSSRCVDESFCLWAAAETISWLIPSPLSREHFLCVCFALPPLLQELSAALAADRWSSAAARSHLTTTLHYITAWWEVKSSEPQTRHHLWTTRTCTSGGETRVKGVAAQKIGEAGDKYPHCERQSQRCWEKIAWGGSFKVVLRCISGATTGEKWKPHDGWKLQILPATNQNYFFPSDSLNNRERDQTNSCFLPGYIFISKK